MAIPGLFGTSEWLTKPKSGAGHIPREGVAHHKVSVDAQLFTELANLVLEHLAQRLNQFQLFDIISACKVTLMKGLGTLSVSGSPPTL